MTDIAAALTNVTPVGIVGIVLVFAAIPLLLTAGSWLVNKYTKSKSEAANHKTSTMTNEELQFK